jgi:hypothetical protein
MSMNAVRALARVTDDNRRSANQDLEITAIVSSTFADDINAMPYVSPGDTIHSPT